MKNIMKLLTIGVLTSTTTITVIACAPQRVVKETPHDITNINSYLDLGKLSSDTAKDFLQKLNQKIKTIKGFENITPDDYYIYSKDTKNNITDKDVLSTNWLDVTIASKSSNFKGVKDINVGYVRTILHQSTLYIPKDSNTILSSNERDLSSLDTNEILQIGFYQLNGEIKAPKMPNNILKVPKTLPREITSLAFMFERLYFDGDISNWDTSRVTDMQGMFRENQKFNQDLSKWDTLNVTDMNHMFSFAINFNQDLSKWDVSNVTNMESMFQGASQFSQDLSKWDVSNVTNMIFMFYGAENFSEDLSKWDVSNVTNMRAMFNSALEFNANISSWVTSNVTNMEAMFYNAKKFNQDLSKWDVSKVTEYSDFAEQSGIKNEKKLPKWQN